MGQDAAIMRAVSTNTGLVPVAMSKVGRRRLPFVKNLNHFYGDFLY